MLLGSGSLKTGGRAVMIGIADRTAVGVDEAIRLSRHVLNAMERGGTGPILVLVDSDSQRMSKRDELLGLNEFLAHLAKCLIYADMQGRQTVGLLYGRSAAGAFLATALATRVLVALPGGRARGYGPALDVQGDKALYRRPQGEGQVHTSFRPGVGQPGSDGRGAFHLGRENLTGRAASDPARQ